MTGLNNWLTFVFIIIQIISLLRHRFLVGSYFNFHLFLVFEGIISQFRRRHNSLPNLLVPYLMILLDGGRKHDFIIKSFKFGLSLMFLDFFNKVIVMSHEIDRFRSPQKGDRLR